MEVLVRLFSVLRERRGRDEERMAVVAGTSAADLYRSMFPQGAPPVLFAVNLEYVSGDRLLCDGDEVAFIPPIGGG